MRLFEAIIEANHRAVAGDENAGLHPGEFGDELPVVALTCIDARLNPLMPEVLGVPEEHFIWLRNAGNIITGPLSSTMRSLALACAVKGGKEIAIIGHTDCLVCKTGTMQLIERFRALGVARERLPENLNDYFGLFASERQNVLRGVDFVRRSPLIGPHTPVHGLLVDIHTGRLEWLVNGYDGVGTVMEATTASSTTSLTAGGGGLVIGEMKFPTAKIGDTVAHGPDWFSQPTESRAVAPLESNPTLMEPTGEARSIAEQLTERAQRHWPRPGESPVESPPVPPKIPLPPPMKPRARFLKAAKR